MTREINHLAPETALPNTLSVAVWPLGRPAPRLAFIEWAIIRLLQGKASAETGWHFELIETAGDTYHDNARVRIGCRHADGTVYWSAADGALTALDCAHALRILATLLERHVQAQRA